MYKHSDLLRYNSIYQ